MVQCLRFASARRLLQLLCASALALAAAGAAADASTPVPAPPACQASAPRQPGRPVAVPAPKAMPLTLQNFVYCSPAPAPVAPASAAAPPAPTSVAPPPPVCPPPAPVEKCTVDPAAVPTSVEINLGKGIGLKFQSAGLLAWVLTGLCVAAVFAAFRRSKPAASSAGEVAPARAWPRGAVLAVPVALAMGLWLGLVLAPGPQLSEEQLQALQTSPQFKAAMVELVEAKAEAARLRERVAVLEMAARTAVPVAPPPPAPAPGEPRAGGYDLFSLVLGAVLTMGAGVAWFMRWVQQRAQMRELLRAIGVAVAVAEPQPSTAAQPAAGPPSTEAKSEAVQPSADAKPEQVSPPAVAKPESPSRSAEAIALMTVRRLLSGRWSVPDASP
jgi:hypothetical protein